MNVLVTGATGTVGKVVVELLLKAGQTVRALTRHPAAARIPQGVQVFPGDLTRPETLREALDGVQRLYLFPVAQTADEVVDLAKSAGVERIVVLSSGAVTGGLDTDFHLPVERAVERSGLEWTHVRPGEFMANKLWLWGPMIRAESVVYEPFPDVAWCPVHERDIAEVAVAALLGEGHHGRFYDLSGPQLISRREQVTAIAAATGRDIRLEVVTPQRARQLYVAQGGFAADNADFLLGFEDYGGSESDPDNVHDLDLAALGPLPTAEAVTGRPARTFAEWAGDHAAEFIAS